jgi:hypothetical protein
MAFEYSPTPELAGVVRSAGDFGLTSHEVWETVMATPDRLPSDLRAIYIDELTAELARRLLEKQGASHDAPLRATHHLVPPLRSPLVSTLHPDVMSRTGLARRCLDWVGRYRKRAATPRSAGAA